MSGGFADEEGPEGCYLTYEPNSGGRMVLLYSQGKIPLNAIGFWCPGPGQSIQGFKFKKDAGRVELIKGIAGGDTNRRKYFSGWCQFIKLAQAKQAYVIKFPNAQKGVEVDLIGFIKREERIVELNLDDGLVEVAAFDAIACVPKYNTTFRGLKSIGLTNFVEKGNIAGAATTM